jgi:hypothetical protein
MPVSSAPKDVTTNSDVAANTIKTVNPILFIANPPCMFLFGFLYGIRLTDFNCMEIGVEIIDDVGLYRRRC